MKKILCIFLLLTITALIETSIFSNMYFLPAMPDLLLLVLLFISIKKGALSGEITGFSSGVIIDFFSTSPFGLNSLVRTIIGYITGFLHVSIETSGFYIPLLLGFVATLIKALLLLIVSFFYTEQIMVYSIFSVTLWIECLLNALFAPLVFKFLSFFKVFSSSNNEEIY